MARQRVRFGVGETRGGVANEPRAIAVAVAVAHEVVGGDARASPRSGRGGRRRRLRVSASRRREIPRRSRGRSPLSRTCTSLKYPTARSRRSWATAPDWSKANRIAFSTSSAIAAPSISAVAPTQSFPERVDERFSAVDCRWPCRKFMNSFICRNPAKMSDCPAVIERPTIDVRREPLAFPPDAREDEPLGPRRCTSSRSEITTQVRPWLPVFGGHDAGRRFASRGRSRASHRARGPAAAPRGSRRNRRASNANGLRFPQASGVVLRGATPATGETRSGVGRARPTRTRRVDATAARAHRLATSGRRRRHADVAARALIFSGLASAHSSPDARVRPTLTSPSAHPRSHGRSHGRRLAPHGCGQQDQGLRDARLRAGACSGPTPKRHASPA